MAYSAVCNTHGNGLGVLAFAILIIPTMRITALSCYDCVHYPGFNPLNTPGGYEPIAAVDGTCSRRQRHSSVTESNPETKLCSIVMANQILEDSAHPDQRRYHQFRRQIHIFHKSYMPATENLIFSHNKYFCTYLKTEYEIILTCTCKGELCNWQPEPSFVPLLRKPTVNWLELKLMSGSPWFEFDPGDLKYKCYKCSDTRPDGNCIADGNYDTLDCCTGCSITLQPGGIGIVDRGCYSTVPPPFASEGGLDCRYIPHPTNPNGTAGYECVCLQKDFCNGIPWIPDKWFLPPGPFDDNPWNPHRTPLPPITRPLVTTAKPTTTSTTTTTTTTTATDPPVIDGC